MSGESSSEKAAGLAARISRARRDAGRRTAHWALGEYVVAALQEHEMLSRGEVIVHFEAIAADPGSGEAERAQAEEVIRLLQEPA